MEAACQTRLRWKTAGLWLALFALAACLAVRAAKPFAGGWNDGSRLATVECLVDYHTFAIDDSIFVRSASALAGPYDPSDPGLSAHGTLDKLFIGGHYYSDKSPTPALLLALGYKCWRCLNGPTAAERPGTFCYAANLAFSGSAYVLSILCLFALCRRLGLPPGTSLLLVASFGLATVALPYAAHVNNHILLLGVVFLIVLQMQRITENREAGLLSGKWSWVPLGLCTGLGYTIDLGVGPVLLLTTACWVVFVGKRRCLVPFLLGALPWVALHHGVNYAIAGTLRPANANPEFFNWPGSPFDATNITGVWHHDALSIFLHGGNMLVGRRGFFWHNLPLLLALPGAVWLLRRGVAEKPTLIWAIAMCGGTWLLYTASSRMTGGLALSIRWFVPFLAPGYFILALFLRHCPDRLPDLALLSGWGCLLIIQVAREPWRGGIPPFFWPIVIGTICSWSVLRLRIAYLQAGTAHSPKRDGWQPEIASQAIVPNPTRRAA